MTDLTPVPIRFPDCIQEEFPDEFPAAWAITEDIIRVAPDFRLGDSAAHWTEAERSSWEQYLRCSVARMVRVSRVLREAGISSGKALDYGAWFGNYSLLLREYGLEVEAADYFTTFFGGTGNPVHEHLLGRNVSFLDFKDHGEMLEHLEPGTYDVILCMGVIEHIPHTPRPTLERLTALLRPGGYLLMDTPNIAYAYNRLKLMRGHSIHPPIQDHFNCSPPFMGHHREYTLAEMEWMVHRLGHEAVALETYNYSLFSIDELAGNDLFNHILARDEPNARECIFSASRKPVEASSPRATAPFTQEDDRFLSWYNERLPALLSAAEKGEHANKLAILEEQRAIAMAERDHAWAERDHAWAERDHARAERDQVQAERDQMQRILDFEREHARAEKEQLERILEHERAHSKAEREQLLRNHENSLTRMRNKCAQAFQLLRGKHRRTVETFRAERRMIEQLHPHVARLTRFLAALKGKARR